MRRRGWKLGCSFSASFFVLCPPPSLSHPNLALSPTCTASFCIQLYFLCSFPSYLPTGSGIPSAYHTSALVDRCWHCMHTHIYTERIPLEFQIHLNSHLLSTSPPPPHPSPVTCQKSDGGFHSNHLCLFQTGVSTRARKDGKQGKSHKHTLACVHLWNCWLAISMHFTLAVYF